MKFVSPMDRDDYIYLIVNSILGLVDIAVRQSPGTALMKPIAVTCIGGLTYATLMTLFVVPCIYELLNRKELHQVREEDLKLLDP